AQSIHAASHATDIARRIDCGIERVATCFPARPGINVRYGHESIGVNPTQSSAQYVLIEIKPLNVTHRITADPPSEFRRVVAVPHGVQPRAVHLGVEDVAGVADDVVGGGDSPFTKSASPIR